MSEFNLGKPVKGKKRSKGAFRRFLKKNRSPIAVITTLVVIILIALWAFRGFHVGLYHFVPWHKEVSLGLDLKGGIYATYEVQDKNVSSEDLNELMNVIRQRLASKGHNEAQVVSADNGRIRVEIPEVSNPEEIRNLIGTTGKLEFVGIDGSNEELIMTGSDIESAKGVVQDGVEPVVAFKLKKTGADKFAKATQKYIGKTIEIRLDGEVISSPTVESAIPGGEGIINGMESIEAAENLATMIMSGSLPVNITELETSTISSSLGSEALRYALYAAAIGLAFILIFMIVFYRMLGVVADIALIVYVMLVIWIHAFFPWGVQLTLPGIAGLILGVGMAVDANVVIFERIKDEYRTGKSLKSAVDHGFNRAFVAIWDGNVTTIITAVILYIFGTVQLKGFSISLAISIICSMLTAIVLTKFLLKHFINFGIKNMKWFNLKREAIGDEAVSDS